MGELGDERLLHLGPFGFGRFRRCEKCLSPGRSQRGEFRGAEAVFNGPTQARLLAAQGDELAIDAGVGGVNRRPLVRRDVGHRAFFGMQPVVRIVGRQKEAFDAVVVGVRNRIELVRVAAGTVDRETEHIRGDVLDRVEHDLVADVGRVRAPRVGDVGRLPEEAGGDQRFDVARLEAVGVAPIDEFIAGDLFEQEAVVGPIVVEGADHVVAVLPDAVERFDDGRVIVGPPRIDVAGRVEPVAAKTLAVMGRRQQPLDQAVKRVGSRVADEFVDLLRRRRQTNEVERRAADQRGSIGRRRERQAALGELFEQERVDRRVHRVVYHSRHRQAHRCLEGPMRPVGFRERGRVGPAYRAALIVGRRPESIQARSVARCASVGREVSGGCWERSPPNFLKIRLSPTEPRTMAGPLVPPFITSGNVRRSSPARHASPPWQCQQ